MWLVQVELPSACFAFEVTSDGWIVQADLVSVGGPLVTAPLIFLPVSKHVLETIGLNPTFWTRLAAAIPLWFAYVMAIYISCLILLYTVGAIGVLASTGLLLVGTRASFSRLMLLLGSTLFFISEIAKIIFLS
jgi:hypothetical protein